MSYYFYLTVFIAILAYTICKDIIQFNKKHYNPYIFRKEEKKSSFFINFCLSVASIISIWKVKSASIVILIFLFYSLCYIISVSILNYLSYKKIKDQEIIFHTVLFDIFVIVVSSFIGIKFLLV